MKWPVWQIISIAIKQSRIGKNKNKKIFVMPISYILDTLPGHEGSRVAGEVTYYIVADDEE